MKHFDFITWGVDLNKSSLFRLILLMAWLLFLVFLMVCFWYNVGVFGATGKLPAYYFFKNLLIE